MSKLARNAAERQLGKERRHREDIELGHNNQLAELYECFNNLTVVTELTRGLVGPTQDKYHEVVHEVSEIYRQQMLDSGIDINAYRRVNGDGERILQFESCTAVHLSERTQKYLREKTNVRYPKKYAIPAIETEDGIVPACELARNEDELDEALDRLRRFPAESTPYSTGKRDYRRAASTESINHTHI